MIEKCFFAKIFIIVSLGLALTVSGCSAFVPRTQKVKAACSEPDATLQVNGGDIYTGSTELDVQRDKVFAYTCYKPGYYPGQKAVSYSISTTGVLDFVGSMIFLVPIVGIFMPGAWHLDETDTRINMVKY